jgi:hypothetical protein
MILAFHDYLMEPKITKCEDPCMTLIQFVFSRGDSALCYVLSSHFNESLILPLDIFYSCLYLILCHSICFHTVSSNQLETTYNIEIKNNKARHNLSYVKYRQIAFWSIYSAVVGSFLEPLGQTKVMHSHQREITWSLFWFVSILFELL